MAKYAVIFTGVLLFAPMTVLWSQKPIFGVQEGESMVFDIKTLVKTYKEVVDPLNFYSNCSSHTNNQQNACLKTSIEFPPGTRLIPGSVQLTIPTGNSFWHTVADPVFISPRIYLWVWRTVARMAFENDLKGVVEDPENGFDLHFQFNTDGIQRYSPIGAFLFSHLHTDKLRAGTTAAISLDSLFISLNSVCRLLAVVPKNKNSLWSGIHYLCGWARIATDCFRSSDHLSWRYPFPDSTGRKFFRLVWERITIHFPLTACVPRLHV